MFDRLLPDKIETERLVLRRPRKDDAAAFFAYAGGEQVGPMAGWEPHRNIRQTKNIIRYYQQEGNVLAITLKGEDVMIGTVGLHKDEHRPPSVSYQLGYALSPDYRHRGIATEAAKAVVKYAFETHLFRILTAYCYPENEPSAKLLESLGFVREGRLRNAYLLYDGTLHDLDCFSLKIEEYIAKNY